MKARAVQRGLLRGLWVVQVFAFAAVDQIGCVGKRSLAKPTGSSWLAPQNFSVGKFNISYKLSDCWTEAGNRARIEHHQ